MANNQSKNKTKMFSEKVCERRKMQTSIIQLIGQWESWECDVHRSNAAIDSILFLYLSASPMGQEDVQVQAKLNFVNIVYVSSDTSRVKHKTPHKI